MNEALSYVYVSNFSFSFINNTSSFDQIENGFSELEKILLEYKKWERISISCSNDILNYQHDESNLELEYRLLSAAQCDDMLFGHYLNLFEKTISAYKSNYPTSALLGKISNQNNTSFPRYYAYEFDGIKWPDIQECSHTSHCRDTLNKNTDFIEHYHDGQENFIQLCTINFNNLTFHKNISSTLNTIKNGTYLDYKKWILLCLNTLNQSYNFISNDPQKNEEDLNPISDYTTTLGKHFSCTRQGKNKPFFDFDENGIQVSINCEYHFKINWMDNNSRINGEDYVRLYFGLKYDQEKGKKSIKVAHIGCHYP